MATIKEMALAYINKNYPTAPTTNPTAQVIQNKLAQTPTTTTQSVTAPKYAGSAPTSTATPTSALSAQDAVNRLSSGVIKSGSAEWYSAMDAIDKANGVVNNTSQFPKTLSPEKEAQLNNLDILNGANNAYVANSGYTFGSAGSANFANTEAGQMLKQAIDARLNAGQDITDLSQQYAEGAQQLFDKNKKASGGAGGFNMQSFLDNYMQFMKGSYDSAKLGETALANSKMEQDILAQEGEKRQGEKDYTDSMNGINQDTYNASENAKIRGMERGISYSAQQAGVEAGVASRALTNKQQAKEVRDLRLGSIRDKINAIKSGNLAELQNIEASYNSKLQASMGDAFMKGTEHQWDMEKLSTQQGYTQSNMGLQQGYDLDKIKANQTNTLTNMGIQQKYDLEKIDVNNTNDQVKLNTMFENDLKKMSVDQQYKVQLQNMDYAFKKDFLKLETGEKKNLMAFDTEQQKIIMGLDQKHKMAILGAQNANDNRQLQAKFQQESQGAMRDIMSSILMNDPNFTAYPSTAEQGKMMTDLLGVVGGKITVDQFVNANYKNLPSSKKAESVAIVKQQIDAISGKGKQTTPLYGSDFIFPN
jgi:hypothetical protein